MDGTRFDQLVRDMLGGGSRRGLLRSVSALPVFGGLASLVVADDEAAEAKKKNKSNKCKKKKKKACDGGKCGTVTVKCNGKKKKVNCGPCDCNPPCDECFTCDVATQTCVVDPEQQGDPCGSTGQVCQADGTCACDADSCPACSTCEGDGTCTIPCDGEGCCNNGTCEPGTDDDFCGADGEACVACAGDELCQANGTCAVPCGDVCASGCPFDSIQDAINAASSGATIEVCAGTYNEDLFIDKDLTIIGAGQGADPSSNTIVDGTGTTRVVRVEGTDVLVAMQDLRITGGAGHCCGTGLDSDADVTLTNVTITGNTADGSGGGLFNNPDRTMTLINCTVTDNSSTDIGGGITNQGILVLTNTDVTDNDADGDGGGIFNDFGATATLDADSSVTGNFAASDGGGVLNNGTITCAAEVVTGNTADDPPAASNCIDDGGTGCDSCSP
jgi:hypothetical protein